MQELMVSIKSWIEVSPSIRLRNIAKTKMSTLNLTKTFQCFASKLLVKISQIA